MIRHKETKEVIIIREWINHPNNKLKLLPWQYESFVNVINQRQTETKYYRTYETMVRQINEMNEGGKISESRAFKTLSGYKFYKEHNLGSKQIPRESKINIMLGRNDAQTYYETDEGYELITNMWDARNAGQNEEYEALREQVRIGAEAFKQGNYDDSLDKTINAIENWLKSNK